MELRDLRRPPAGLSVPTGANLDLDAASVLTVGSDCAIGKMTVSLELDRAARERGLALGLRPDGPDRHRDRGLGHLRGCRRGRLHRGRGRAARRRGRRRAETSSGSRARARSSTPSSPASRWGSCTGARRTPTCSATWRARRRSRAAPATRSRRFASSSSSTSGCPCPSRPRQGGRGGRQHAGSRRGRGAVGDRRRPRQRRVSPLTIRCASDPIAFSTPSWPACRRCGACAVRAQEQRDRSARREAGRAHRRLLARARRGRRRPDRRAGRSAPRSRSRIFRAALEAGAHPYTNVGLDGVQELLLDAGSEEQLAYISPVEWNEMETIDALVTIWSEANTRSLSRVDPDRHSRYIAAQPPALEQTLGAHRRGRA